MIAGIFNTLIYNPLYNGIVFLMGILPWADVGVVIIIFTFLIRLILFPISQKSVKTQLKMREIEPDVEAIKKKYNKDKQEQAKHTMELYKERGVNPFASFFLVLIQLPIIFALYFIFLRGGFPMIDQSALYSFVQLPTQVNTMFLGIVDITEKSIVLSLITGITQFIQARLASAQISSPKSKTPSFAGDFARSMQIQMKYVFPILVAFISYTLSAMIAVYWITSNLFTIGQEIFIRRRSKTTKTT